MKTWTRKAAQKITGIPDRRLLFYSEQNMLPFFKKAVGRGIAREYSRKDIFFLMIIKELDSIGFSLSRIRPIIMYLHTRTLDWTSASEMAISKGPKIWENETLTKDPVILVLSLPQGPDEHALSPDSKNYDNEIFFQFQAKNTVLANRPSQIVLNLNQIFKKAEF